MRQIGQRSLFNVALAAVAAGTAFATVAVAGVSSGRAPGDPVQFLKGVVRQIVANDYAAAWQTLVPAQQRLVPQDEYVRCESASPIPGRLAWIRAVHSFTEPVLVAGADGEKVASRAVTFRLKISQPVLGESVVVTHTVHAVKTDGRWGWILPEDRLRLHQSGTCGSTPVPPGTGT